MSLPITVVIIAKNEADRIAKAIDSVQFCQEVIVIDSDSNDETVQVSESHGARVIQQPFLGYGAQKNFGFSKASCNWILSLDSDEIVSKALRQEIESAFSGLEVPFNGFSMPRKNFFLGKELKYGRESRDRLTRLFLKEKGKYNDALVHERLSVEGAVKTLQGPLLHFTYRSLAHAKEKMKKYAQLGAQQLHDSGKSRSALLIALAYPVYFVKHYLVYGNILNGTAGLQWSKLMANYHTQKYKLLSQINSEVRTD